MWALSCGAAHAGLERYRQRRHEASMTREHTDLTGLISSEDVAQLREAAETNTSGMAAVREQHSRYYRQATDEIRCTGCDQPLEIPFISNTTATVYRIFAAHQASQLGLLLANDETGAAAGLRLRLTGLKKTCSQTAAAVLP